MQGGQPSVGDLYLQIALTEGSTAPIPSGPVSGSIELVAVGPKVPGAAVPAATVTVYLSVE
jgi:hypothetical protein